MNRIAANLLTGRTIYITTDEQGNLKPAAKVYGGTPTATVTDIQTAGKGLLIITDKGSLEVATAKKTLFVADETPTDAEAPEGTVATTETAEATTVAPEQDADEAEIEARQAEGDAAAAAADQAIREEAQTERDTEAAA